MSNINKNRNNEYHNVNDLRKKMRYKYNVGLIVLVFVLFVLISTYMYNRSCVNTRNKNLLDLVTIYSTNSSNIGTIRDGSFDIGILSSDLYSL